MRLTALTIKNFKGIDEAGICISFAPITLLFGPNNAGKSTVIQALHLMREVLCNNNYNPDSVAGGGSSINLGGFKKFVHKHDLTRTVSIGLEFDLEGRDLPSFVRRDEIKWQQMQTYLFEHSNRSHTELDSTFFDAIRHIDNNESSNSIWETAQDALNRISSIGVRIGISWGVATEQPFISLYEVTMNGMVVCGISCKENGTQLFEGIDFSPILTPSEKEQCRKHIEINLLSDNESETSDDNEIELPKLFEIISQIINFDATWESLIPGSSCTDYCPGYTEILNPEVRGNALPLWDRPLDLSEITPSKICESFLSSLLVGPGLLLRDLLDAHLLYIGPLRAIPPRNFLPAQTADPDRWANGLAAWDILASADPYELEQVNQCLSELWGKQPQYYVCRKNNLTLDANGTLAFALQVALMEGDVDEATLPLLRQLLTQAPDACVVFRSHSSGVEVVPHDMGVGIAQVMPVLVAGALAKRNAVIAVEQPELHIHPAWQTALGDVFCRAISNDDPPMFLLETHSEHLMLRLLRRVRETSEAELPAGFPKMLPEMISVLCVQSNEDGRTEIIRIPVTPDGDFGQKWPNGFFAERAKELF